MTTASAPGKIILFGEHAVVHGRPALAAPVTQVAAVARVTESSRPGVWIEAPDIGIADELSQLAEDLPLATIVRGVLAAIKLDSHPSLTLQVTSTIPVASGLGSGTAVSVAVIRALSTHLGKPLDDERVNALAYETEKLYHGAPSGIDNTVITYARPVYFIKGKPIEPLQVGQPFTLVIGDTGIRAPTKESISAVRSLWEADKPRWEAVFDRAAAIARQARTCIEAGEIQSLGGLMDANHALLQEMTVSSPKLDRLVVAARRSGALGAKLSGSGRGGNMIALVRKEDASRISQDLLDAGASQALVTTISPA
ncbi:MAG: mevalonate kinase [Chloroflexota bacterium]